MTTIDGAHIDSSARFAVPAVPGHVQGFAPGFRVLAHARSIELPDCWPGVCPNCMAPFEGRPVPIPMRYEQSTGRFAIRQEMACSLACARRYLTDRVSNPTKLDLLLMFLHDIALRLGAPVPIPCAPPVSMLKSVNPTNPIAMTVDMYRSLNPACAIEEHCGMFAENSTVYTAVAARGRDLPEGFLKDTHFVPMGVAAVPPTHDDDVEEPPVDAEHLSALKDSLEASAAPPRKPAAARGGAAAARRRPAASRRRAGATMSIQGAF